MAPKAFNCPSPGCEYATDILEADLAIRFLEIHVAQAHGVNSKPEKPKKPDLEMIGNVVDALDWETFIHKFDTYKKLAGISGDGGSHLLACLSKDVYSVLFSAYGADISKQNEATLKVNIMKLVVREKNRILSVMELLALKQESDERIVKFVSRVRAKARHCTFKLACKCGENVDYTDEITLYMLIAGLSDPEIQEELLNIEEITLEKAEKKAMAKEAAKYSQSEMSSDKLSRLKSSYAKEKYSDTTHSDPENRKCKFCGDAWHENREKECKAANATCNRCGKKGHFKKVCRSKKQPMPDNTGKNPKPETSDCLQEELLYMKSSTGSHQLSAISTGDLIYDKQSKKWIQRSLKNKKVHVLALQLETCKESLKEFKMLRENRAGKLSDVMIQGIADTGCSIMCSGLQLCHRLGVPLSSLLKSNVSLKVADGRALTVVGAVPVNVSVQGRPDLVSKQLLHIVSELKSLFVSKSCLMDLGAISPDFPSPPPRQERLEAVNEEESSPSRAPCGCLTRSETPGPPKIPFEPTEENVPKLKQFIVDYYASSTMNLCSHQQLPKITGPPVHYSLKPDAKPVAIHTPAVLPIHWTSQVREQLLRDVKLGILEEVPPEEPTKWQHRMVVVRKPNGTPRRTVDMQKLNKATLRTTHPLASPYVKAMSVPSNMYKTVTDAWEGYHSIPLDLESSRLTQFITPFGVYRYKRSPQGFHGSGDAYNRRRDEIERDVRDIIRQVDDSLLWKSSIEGNFNHTCAYMTLCGENGILQNPEKFQFCQKSVNWAGFVIGENTVKPMMHLTAAVRNFPTPVNRTDMRSFMALMQQVSYTTAVAPLLLPFRHLLKEGVPWVWTEELDKVFQDSKRLMADRIEEGVRIFDPYKVTLLLTDWCKHGVGYMLTQKHCRCENTGSGLNTHCCKQGWKVCAVGSRFTLPAEANYSPTEGELLGVTNALEKTKYFTLGCPNLYVGTDHKPLLGLLSEDMSLEKISNPRLVRLKEKTLGWNFQTVYIPGKQLGGTDALSRYGVRHDCDGEEVEVRKHIVGLLATEEQDVVTGLDEDALVGSVMPALKPVTWSDVREASKTDTEYQELVRIIVRGFPSRKEDLTPALQIFFKCRDKLRLVENVILFGDRILIPALLRPRLLEVLHSSHQGSTGMLLRAEASMFWPNMSRDIHETRLKCRSCDVYAPSQPDMPPITPEVPVYPFQHVCSDYFSIAGKQFCVIVDRFSGWFNIEIGKGGAVDLVRIFSRLFQDMGVPESLTTDGGTVYMSQSFQELLEQYKVKHRVSSVGFPHGNTRSEVAVKTAKRLLRTNMNDRGDLDTVTVSRALLQYRNTPDRDIGLSPSELLYGRKLRDFLPHVPDKYRWPKTQLMRKEWDEIADWREKALAKRCSKIHEKLSEHTKELPQLSRGDLVLVQNQLGNSPRRWEKRGTVTEVLPNRQYRVMMDGSRRISLRNRKFLRKFIPLNTADVARTQPPLLSAPVQTFTQNMDQSRHPEPVPSIPEEPVRGCPTFQKELEDDNPSIPLIPELIPQDLHEPVRDMQQPVLTQSHPQPAPVLPTPVLPESMTPTQPALRRSTRTNKGNTSRYGDFMTGDGFDDATANITDNHVVEIVGYSADGFPVVNTHLGQVYMLGKDPSFGPLYAMPLPLNQKNMRAYWTLDGWVWDQTTT